MRPEIRARDAGLDRSQAIASARIAVLGGELLGELVQPMLAPRDQYDAMTPTRELARDLGADTRRRAGDQRGGVAVGLWEAHRAA